MNANRTTRSPFVVRLGETAGAIPMAYPDGTSYVDVVTAAQWHAHDIGEPVTVWREEHAKMLLATVHPDGRIEEE